MKNTSLNEYFDTPVLEKFEEFIDDNDIGVWEWNVLTEETKLNRKWASILGYSLGELEGPIPDLWGNLVHPADLSVFNMYLEKFLTGASDFYRCEVRMRHKSGDWIWILNKGRIISWDRSGGPEWIIGSHVDVTSQKESELLLGYYKNLLKQTNKAAHIGYWEVDMERNTMFWSDVTHSIHEVADDYVPTLSKAIRFYPKGKDRDKILQSFFNAIRNGKSYDVELQILTAKGNKKWVRTIGIPKEKDKPSAIICGLFQDIDEKAKAKQALEFQEEQFRKTFDYSAIGMALVSLAGSWLKVNSSLLNMLGYNKNELYSMSFQDITHPDDIKRDQAFLNEIIKGKRESYHVEKRYFHKRGGVIWTILNVTLVKNDEDDPIHFVFQITNINERKQAEANAENLLSITQEQNDRLMNFTHIVSHNLRSHSTNISMMLDLMKMDVPNIINHPVYQNVILAAKKLNGTINHLNEVAMMNENIFDRLESLNLLTYINESLLHVKAQLDEVGAQVKVQVNDDVYVVAVPAYLESIVLNLLTNTIKYRSDKRDLEIRLLADKKDDFVKLSVSDNGLGIDLERHGKKIFGMYKTFHRKKDSRGIGLFISKNQAEAMGGKIEVESSVDVGTSFHIYFKHEKY
ncbi:MAG: PAS domain S-box protein [Bacteroidota bacterium]